MARFGKKSIERLKTCDPRLQAVFYEAVKHFDIRIIVGHRNEAEQNDAFERGASKKCWPESKHNTFPSMAVDAAPYPIDWDDRERFFYMAGLVIGVAGAMGIKLRWGGCWAGDNDFRKNKFDDFVHFELRREQ